MARAGCDAVFAEIWGARKNIAPQELEPSKGKLILWVGLVVVQARFFVGHLPAGCRRYKNKKE